MCGIAGVVFRDSSRRPERSSLQAMGTAIAHRGPDAEGFLLEPGAGFVHRRLSIIDLSGGDQPISNEDGTISVVLNGELYNYQELRKTLTNHGHQFRTQSDTEVLVHLYEEHGDQLVEKLRGMFAFALWDSRKRSVLLARDRVGIKPLFVYRDAEKLLFASELKAILAFPDVARRLDLTSLEDYLAYGFVPGHRSIFRNIDKLLPGHTLTVGADHWQSSPRRYWQLRFQPDQDRNERDWKDAVLAKVEESVRIHMIADVPVGAFLSGGVDSAVVVGCASQVAATPLQTFSLGFEGIGSSCELPAANQASNYFHTRHAEAIVKPDAVKLLDALTHYFDEPFADSSALPTFLLAEMARRQVKVVLSGDGGDEAFGGYARYAHDLREAKIRSWLPGFTRSALGSMASVWPKLDWLPRPLRLKTFLTNMSLEAGSAYANTIQICRLPLRRDLLAPDVAAQLDGRRSETAVTTAFAEAPASDYLAGMIAADAATLLPDDYLYKVDRAAMAHGLEVRPPLLDHELLELTAQMPSRFKVHRGQTKWILKQAFADRLPRGATSRPKQGFEAPIDAWLRGPLREMFQDSVLARSHLVANMINQPVADSLFRAHLSRIGRHGSILWALLVLARWCERYRLAV